MSAERGVLDLRTYKLKAGAGAQFGRILRDEALPMLARFDIDVLLLAPILALGLAG